MLSKRQFLAMFVGLLFYSRAFLLVNANASCDEELRQVQNTCQAYQRKVMISLREIFQDQKQCSPFPKCKNEPIEELKLTTAKLERSERNFQLLAEAQLTRGSQTRVAQPDVTARLNDPVQFSCLSRAEPLSLCLWMRNIDGKRERIVIDKELVQQGRKTDVEGVAYFGGGLDAGDCGLKIRSTKKEDLGQWSCTLVTNDGHSFGGYVNLVEKEVPIYFATMADGIKAYSPQTGKVATVVDTTDNAFGVAYDTARNHIYWNSYFQSNSSSKIYRSKVESDSGVETLLNTNEYGLLRGMDFDWIAQNLYVVSQLGHILACDCRANRPFHCVPVLSGQGGAVGIALNPYRGTMYWTSWSEKSGLAIDFRSSRLYWADCGAKMIQSSALDGGDVRTVGRQFSSGPFGMALHNHRLYWSLPEENTLQSSNKDFGDIRTVYNGTARIRHLVVPDWSLARNRTNPCGQKTCRDVCVLTESTYKCL